MENRQRDALGLPRRASPGLKPLLKVTPVATGVARLISQNRIASVVPHQDGSLIVFSDESQMIVAESIDDIAAAGG
jgi:hypothetical protein